MAALAEAITTGIQDIPLSRLFVAPWNARKTFDEHSLAEITASITQHGIQVPLTVRPILHKGKTSGDFEIIAGHRRRIGAERAFKSDAPCIVRDLSDAEAREIGMIDNLQREDLAPLEEAKAFAELMKAPAATAEAVAAKLGKATSFVIRRLKLLDAIQPIQEALAANAIEVGHALEIARLDEKQQAKLFHWLGVVADGQPTGFAGIDEGDEDDDEDDFDDNDSEDNDEPESREEGTPTLTWRQTGKSVAELKREIRRTMLVVLSNAPFPLEDNIAPIACSECPKRTVNSTLLFNDVAQDACTDSECYRGKIRAWVRYSLQYAEENGKKLVLLGNAYWYDKTESVIPKQNVKVIEDGKDEACESQEDAIWYDGPKAGHSLTICRNTNCKTHYGFSSRGGSNHSNAAEAASQKAKRKTTLGRLNVQKRYRNELFKALGQAKVNDAVLNQLALDVALHCVTRMTSIYNPKLAVALGWDEKALGYGSADKLTKLMQSLTHAERLRAAHMAIHANDLAAHEYSVDRKDYRPEGFERLAQLLSVDHKALRTAEEDRQAEKQKGAAESAKKKATKDKKAAKTTAKSDEAVKPKTEPAAKTATKKAPKSKPAAKPANKAAKKTATKKTAKAKK